MSWNMDARLALHKLSYLERIAFRSGYADGFYSRDWRITNHPDVYALGHKAGVKDKD